MEMGKTVEALKDFDKCVGINPSYAPGYSNRAGAQFKMKAYSKALADANLAIQLDKEFADAYVNRGMAKEMLRNMNGACEDWHKASELGSPLGKHYQSTNCSN